MQILKQEGIIAVQKLINSFLKLQLQQHQLIYKAD